MKIVVNNGRSVRVTLKPGIAAQGEKPAIRPIVKDHGPATLIDLPDDEAQRLIALGFARKYEPMATQNAEAPKAA